MGGYIYFTGEYLWHRCMLCFHTRPLCTIACPSSARVHLIHTHPSSKVPRRASFLLARIRPESCERFIYPIHNFSSGAAPSVRQNVMGKRGSMFTTFPDVCRPLNPGSCPGSAVEGSRASPRHGKKLWTAEIKRSQLFLMPTGLHWPNR
jgi:hypothetical protein